MFSNFRTSSQAMWLARLRRIGNLHGIYLEFRRPEDYDRFANGLRKAGLAE
jgi:hypothetical protein